MGVEKGEELLLAAGVKRLAPDGVGVALEYRIHAGGLGRECPNALLAVSLIYAETPQHHFKCWGL